MDYLPYYVLIGIAIGFVAVLFLYNFRLALDYLVIVAKVAAILLSILILGWLFGWFEPPWPVAKATSGLRRLWQPFQRNLLDFFRSLFR